MLGEKELLELKEKIDKIQTMKTKYEGQLEQLNKSLQDLGYNSIDEAREDLKKFETEYNKLKDEIEALENKIQEVLKEF